MCYTQVQAKKEGKGKRTTLRAFFPPLLLALLLLLPPHAHLLPAPSDAHLHPLLCHSPPAGHHSSNTRRPGPAAVTALYLLDLPVPQLLQLLTVRLHLPGTGNKWDHDLTGAASVQQTSITSIYFLLQEIGETSLQLVGYLNPTQLCQYQYVTIFPISLITRAVLKVLM